MQNPQVQIQSMKHSKQQKQCRMFFITSLHKLRSQHPELTRQIVYLALAVIDKFLLKREQKSRAFQPLKERRESFLLASLWIALKFQSYSSQPLCHILMANASDPPISQVVKAECEILEEIEFQIPIEHTYATMVESFMEIAQNDSHQLAAQCLKFYSQAIKLSEEFVLCSQLGPIILEFIRTKTLKDPRLRKAYVLIKKAKLEKAQIAHVTQLGPLQP